jgi:hypothetical protein
LKGQTTILFQPNVSLPPIFAYGLFCYLPTNMQGYQIGRIVAFWVIVFFGQFFYYKSGKIIFHGKNYVPISPLAIFKEL